MNISFICYLAALPVTSQCEGISHILVILPAQHVLSTCAFLIVFVVVAIQIHKQQNKAPFNTFFLPCLLQACQLMVYMKCLCFYPKGQTPVS